MKDLDFDELDRAVNSLIANGAGPSNVSVVRNTTNSRNDLPKTPIDSHFVNRATPIISDEQLPRPTLVSPAFNAAPFNPTISRQPVLDREQEVKPIPTIPIFVESSSPIVSRRSSGRFMDVVHPSSDMRTTLVMPNRISREGVSVAPAPIDEIAHRTITVAQSNATFLKPVKPIATPEPIESSWPDPIEFENNNHKEPAVSVVVDGESSDDDIDRINDDISNSLKQAPEIQESPFLSGAKVAKRPLGGNSLGYAAVVNDAIPDKTETNLGELNTDAFIESSASQVSVVAPLPPELNGDLLSIESANEVALNSTPKPDNAPALVSVPTEKPTGNNQQKAITSADGPTSIAQQYQEKPSTGDQNSGSIYDTDSYHKAIVKSTKKKGSWLWIVWILLLLILGAGVGAGIYFFVLPLL